MASGSVRCALEQAMTRIEEAALTYSRPQPRLVAVSKTKPISLIQEAYECGQRHFGENYVQELVDKAPLLPDDIQWHFIGHLQSNKAKQLLGIPNLYMVESVDSERLATRLNTVCDTQRSSNKLKVLVQVNTSGEDTKSGVEPQNSIALAQHIFQNCPKLEFSGLMTIGRYGDTTPECFQVLVDCRNSIAEALGLDASSLELSMGMSGDFPLAIEMGSTSVRLGSTIFGARNYSA